ncbi:uncharacterized protein LOC142765419 isoform X2 [Rhipicephalus microplus]|uniref:uncharacterized protein LOC142765419 isoform X2 n=1 Tax=Rhipicephalus microplus TaxID=6941 RepID=UPI003F6D843F
MSTNFRFFALYFTSIWLTMLVEKATCPKRKGPPLPGPHRSPQLRLPHSPSSIPPLPSLSPIANLSWSPPVFSPMPSPGWSFQFPSPSSPIAGPSRTPPQKTLQTVPRRLYLTALWKLYSRIACMRARQEIPPPSSTSAPIVARQSKEPLHPTLQILVPRPGLPGSPQKPGHIKPGPSQLWLASAFHRGLIPAEKLRRNNQQCSKYTICVEGTCCLYYGSTRKRCKPLGSRGDRCSLRALTNVYTGACPCGPNQGTCEHGICT